jgi:hypothetical protein
MPRASIKRRTQLARKRFFLEKEAKTFANWGARWIQRAPQGLKFLGSFFKKELPAFIFHESQSTTIDIRTFPGGHPGRVCSAQVLPNTPYMTRHERF